MNFACWRCGAPLNGMILPVSRREVCRGCEAEIHVCRMCIHFRPKWRDACAEERAEDVSNRELANFCDYFAPSRDAFAGEAGDESNAAREQLDALFAPSASRSEDTGNTPTALEDLFRKPGDE